MTYELTEFTVALDEGDDDFGLVGNVTFSPEFREGGLATAKNLSPRPKVFPLRARYGYIDDSNQLKRAGGAVGVRLPANDPELGIPQLPYRADFDLHDPDTGQPISISPAYFAAPDTDTTLYLVKVIPSPDRTSVVVRAKGYAEDILDSTPAGRELLTGSLVVDADGNPLPNMAVRYPLDTNGELDDILIEEI